MRFFDGTTDYDSDFVETVRVAFQERPDPAVDAALVQRLAETARAGFEPTPTQVTGRARARRPRWALASKAAIAVGLFALSVGGLAVAGVKLPAPARDALDSIGVTLPNQADDESTGAATFEAPPPIGLRGNSAAAHRRVLARRAAKDAIKRGKALGHTRGKAVGLTGGTPPGQTSSTQPSPPAQSNAGGSATGISHSSSHRKGKGHK